MKKISLLLILIIFINQSCDFFITKSNYKDDIQEFIDDLNLEMPQKIQIDISDKSKDIFFFQVKYGPPKDCASGCFYDILFGLKNNKKINSFDLYNIDNRDSLLFTETFLQKVKNYDEFLYYCQFLPLLARDEDTPISTLTIIANNLYTYISPHIGELLINNMAVQNNENILILLANLPIGSYKEIIEHANSLIDDL